MQSEMYNKKCPIKIDLDAEVSSYNAETKFNDYIGMQKNVLSVLRNEGFLENNVVTNEESGMQIAITAKGIKETLGSGKRFQNLPRDLKRLKIATLRALPEIIRNASLLSDDVPNSHGNKSRYAYFYSEAVINDVDVGIKIDVRKSVLTNKFWIHNVQIEKSPKQLNPIQGQDIHEPQNFSINTISDNDLFVTSDKQNNLDNINKKKNLEILSPATTQVLNEHQSSIDTISHTESIVTSAGKNNLEKVGLDADVLTKEDQIAIINDYQEFAKVPEGERVDCNKISQEELQRVFMTANRWLGDYYKGWICDSQGVFIGINLTEAEIIEKYERETEVPLEDRVINSQNDFQLNDNVSKEQYLKAYDNVWDYESHEALEEEKLVKEIQNLKFLPTDELVKNIRSLSRMEGRNYTLKELSDLHREKADFSNDPKKAKCFNSIIKECQEQELARSQNSTHFMKQEMMMELTPTPGA